MRVKVPVNSLASSGSLPAAYRTDDSVFPESEYVSPALAVCNEYLDRFKKINSNLFKENKST